MVLLRLGDQSEPRRSSHRLTEPAGEMGLKAGNGRERGRQAEGEAERQRADAVTES